MQTTTATLFRHLKDTRIQVFHDNNRDFRSRTLFVGGERCPVTLFESFVERRSLLKLSSRLNLLFEPCYCLTQHVMRSCHKCMCTRLSLIHI